MKKKYKFVRLPEEAYLGFSNKKSIIEGILKEEKIKKRFTMADTLRYFSQKKTFIYNDEISNFLNHKKNRRIRSSII